MGIAEIVASARPHDAPALDHGRDQVAGEVVREMAPVGRVEQDQVGIEAGRDAAGPVGPAEHVRGVDGASRQRLRGRQVELRRCQPADERKALAKRLFTMTPMAKGMPNCARILSVLIHV